MAELNPVKQQSYQYSTLVFLNVIKIYQLEHELFCEREESEEPSTEQCIKFRFFGDGTGNLNHPSP